jgi:hypothetical protein
MSNLRKFLAVCFVSLATVAFPLRLVGITLAHANTVTDPAGDAGSGPDIASVTGTYNSTTLYVNVLFVTGTFDPAKSGAIIALNTDLNISTGCCDLAVFPGTFFPLGAEYSLGYTASEGSGKFLLTSFSSDGTVHSGVLAKVTPTFVTDGIDLALPLSLIGGNGLLEFGMVTGTDNGDGTFDPLDFLVDDDGLINQGPTSLVPDVVPLPAALPLFAGGLGGLGVMGWWRRRRAATA